MKWYADNSELSGIKGAEIPDILLFGGLIVSPETENYVKAEVEKIKRRYSGHARAPVKWNLKDLRELYKTQAKELLYDRLMKTSRNWREEIFRCLADCHAVLLVACIEGYSSRRAVLKERKEELTRFIFTNALMRYGLHVRDEKPDVAYVVLDWPDKGISKPFDSEYAYAYRRGKTADGRITYQCGKLSSLGFSDSVLFTNMHHSTLLQVADLVVGATREFLECCLEKRKAGVGLDCIKLVREKFRGAPNQIVGRGLVIPSGNATLLARAKRGVRELLYAS